MTSMSSFMAHTKNLSRALFFACCAQPQVFTNFNLLTLSLKYYNRKAALEIFLQFVFTTSHLFSYRAFISYLAFQRKRPILKFYCTNGNSMIIPSFQCCVHSLRCMGAHSSLSIIFTKGNNFFALPVCFPGGQNPF